MRAMILAAGRGERLRPLTQTMPKPMIPIASEPLIVHQIRWLRHAGIREIVINLHHLGEQIESKLGYGADLGVHITYCHEEVLLDTGGAIANALPFLLPGPFLVLNGDVWTNYPFKELVQRMPNTTHLVLTPTPGYRESGDFCLEGNFVRRGDENDLVFCGIGVLTEDTLRHAPEGIFSITKDVYFKRLRYDEITGELYFGTWFDIGTHNQLKAVRRLYL
ncbi:MAG: nucleotidyltransferase family protein [Pseudomonadales bacterium]